MTPKLLAAAFSVLLAAGTAAAAMHHHHHYPYHGRTVAGAVAVTLEGVVDTLDLAPGQGIPRFILRESDGTRSTILLRPAWASLAPNWKLASGDRLSVLAYPSAAGERSYVAVELRNLATGATLRLPYGRHMGGDCWGTPDCPGCRW